MDMFKPLLLLLVLLFFLFGCSSGEIRALNDALAENNGEYITYDSYSRSGYLADYLKYYDKFNGSSRSGKQRLCNESNHLRFHLKVIMEDDTYRQFNLTPGDCRTVSYSVYNLIEDYEGTVFEY